MKIGVFDSGLGGLLTMRALVKHLPAYDYIYLGDTQRAPYGEHAGSVLERYTIEALQFLFSKQCALVIIACNAASSEALRAVQQNFLPCHFPNKKVLGVIRPIAETVAEMGLTRVGVIGTRTTINSGAYAKELQNIRSLRVFGKATPLLAPLVDGDGLQWSKPILTAYIQPLLKKRIDGLVLGCTHYSLLAARIRHIIGPHIRIISQETALPGKLQSYLFRHPEIESQLSKNKTRSMFATERTPALERHARQWFGNDIVLRVAHL